MPKVYRDGNKVEYLVERLDGGRNTKDSPSLIAPQESPDELNVAYDDQGSVGTRKGTTQYNTAAIGTFAVQAGISYNGSMIVAAGGSVWRISGTTAVTIPSAQSVFSTTGKISMLKYQGLLMLSDGNLSYKYSDTNSFFRLGLQIPSACTGSGTSAGDVAADTYYYKVANVNTQAVVGQVGSVSAGVTIGASATIGLTDVPVAPTSHGVDQRWIYRATSTAGTFKKVGEIADNSTTTFADNTAVGSETLTAETDAEPTGAWTTAIVHKDRLIYDDPDDRSLLDYTEYTNPYWGGSLNFKRVNTQSGKEITAIDVQDDLVTIFMDTDENWVVDLVDPSDDTTWVGPELSPANYGIAGPMAKQRVMNSLMFVGKQNNRITGFHLLSGLNVQQSTDGKLRTESISERIEPDILGMPKARWPDISMILYDNRIFISIAVSTDTSGYNEHILWFDVTRLGQSGQPGSWGYWDGVPVSCFWEHEGDLYGGSSDSTGLIYKFEQNSFADNGAAIDSYWWGRLDGLGEQNENFHKDFRHANLFFAKLGAYNMTFKYRVDGDSASGDMQNISLNPGGSLWGSMVWGVDPWGGGRVDGSKRVPLGVLSGRRIQIGFDNQNTVDQGFKVHRYSIEATLRSRRSRNG